MAANSAKVGDRRNLKYILFGHFGNCFSNVDGRIVRGKRFLVVGREARETRGWISDLLLLILSFVKEYEEFLQRELRGIRGCCISLLYLGVFTMESLFAPLSCSPDVPSSPVVLEIKLPQSDTRREIFFLPNVWDVSLNGFQAIC